MFEVGVVLNLLIWVCTSGLLGVGGVQAQLGSDIASSSPSPCECSPVCSGNVTSLDCPDGRVVPRNDCPCCTVCAHKEGETCEEPTKPCDADFGLICSPEGVCKAELVCDADDDCPSNRFCLGGVCVNPCPILNPCQGALKGGECVTEEHRPVCQCPSGQSRNSAGDECVSVGGDTSGCEYEGHFYSVREKFYVGRCREQCECGEGGKLACGPISCGPGLFPAGHHSGSDLCVELKNRPDADECCVVVACAGDSPLIVSNAAHPRVISHREEEGQRALVGIGHHPPPPVAITEEEYQQRIKDLQATLNQDARETASPGEVHSGHTGHGHEGAFGQIEESANRTEVHLVEEAAAEGVISHREEEGQHPLVGVGHHPPPPVAITEEEYQRRIKDLQVTLNQDARETASLGEVHSGHTGHSHESAFGQMEESANRTEVHLVEEAAAEGVISHRKEEGQRALVGVGHHPPPAVAMTEEEYQRRIKDLQATLNRDAGETVSPREVHSGHTGHGHEGAFGQMEESANRTEVHLVEEAAAEGVISHREEEGQRALVGVGHHPPPPVAMTEEEYQRRIKDLQATLNRDAGETVSPREVHSGHTGHGHESAFGQMEESANRTEVHLVEEAAAEGVISHREEEGQRALVGVGHHPPPPVAMTEEEYQRRIKDLQVTLNQDAGETVSPGEVHSGHTGHGHESVFGQMEESANRTEVHLVEEAAAEGVISHREEEGQRALVGVGHHPPPPVAITEEEYQQRIKGLQATLNQDAREAAPPGEVHSGHTGHAHESAFGQTEESANRTEVHLVEEAAAEGVTEEDVRAITLTPTQEEDAETKLSVDIESDESVTPRTDMADEMETTTAVPEEAPTTFFPLETQQGEEQQEKEQQEAQQQEEQQEEEQQQGEEVHALFSEDMTESTATEIPAVVVEYDGKGNSIQRITVQEFVDVVTVEPEVVTTLFPSEESSTDDSGVSHVQSVREGKQVPDDEAHESSSHTETTTPTTSTSTTTTSIIESSTVSTLLEGRPEEKQSKLGVLKVLSRTHNSTTLNLPSTRGGELYYQVLGTSSGLAPEAEWQRQEVSPGQVVVTLEGLKPGTSYTLKWSGKDATTSKLSVTTLAGCEMSPNLYIAQGESWNDGCQSTCACTATGKECQPRCQLYPGNNTNPLCVEHPHPLDPNCCVTYECQRDAGVTTDKATTMETTSRVASGGLPKLIVTKKTFRSLTFAWDDFRSRNYEGGYVAEYRELENEQEAEDTSTPWMRQEQVKGEVSPKGEMTIDELKPNTLYQVRVSIFDDPELEKLGSSTETITVKTEMGCIYKDTSYSIGEFYNGCEERCYCNPDGSVRCKERCAIPFFKRGSYSHDPFCREQPTDLDECCVLVVCSHGEASPEYDPCANIACGPNAECVPYHMGDVEDQPPLGVCNCRSGYTGRPDNLTIGCQPVTNGSGEGMAMGGCTFKNNSYKAGESFYDNCDYHCLCNENTEISCNIRCQYQMGQELSEPGCELMPSPDDSCCAIRVCNSTINTTAEDPNSSPSQITEGCTEGNQTYAKNETFYVGCHSICTCIGYGDKSCVPRCPANKEVKDSPETRCHTLNDPKDSCCTVTVCDEPNVELEVKKEIAGMMENSTMVEGTEEEMASRNHSHVMDDNMEKNVTLQEATEEEMMMKNMSMTDMMMEGKNMTDMMEEKNMTTVDGDMMEQNMTMEEDMTEKNVTMESGMMEENMATEEDTTESFMTVVDGDMMEKNMTMDEEMSAKNMTTDDEMTTEMIMVMEKENDTMMMSEESHRENHTLVMLEKKNRANDGPRLEITDVVPINSTTVMVHVFPSKYVMQQLNVSKDPSFTVLYSLDSLEWHQNRVRPKQPSMFSTDVILEVGNLEPGRTYQFRVDFQGSVSPAVKATTHDASGLEPIHRQGPPGGSHVAACHVDGTIMIPVGGTYEMGCSEVCLCQAPGQLTCRPRCPTIEMPPVPQEHNCTLVQSPQDSCCTIVECSGGVHKGHVAGTVMSMGNKWSGPIPHPEDDVNHIAHTHVKDAVSSSSDLTSHTHSNDRLASHSSNSSLSSTTATDRSSEHSSGLHPTFTLSTTPQPPHNQVEKTGNQNVAVHGKKGQSQEAFGFTIFPHSDDANHLHDDENSGFTVQRVHPTAGTATTTATQGKEQSGAHSFTDPTREQTHLLENEMHTSSSPSGPGAPLNYTSTSDQSNATLEHPPFLTKEANHRLNTLGLDTGVGHQAGQNAHQPFPTGEGAHFSLTTGEKAYLPRPTGEHDRVSQPAGETVYLPDPTGENAYLPHPHRANNFLSDPSGGTIFSTHHGEGHLPQFAPGGNEHTFPPAGSIGLAEHTGEKDYLQGDQFHLSHPTGENVLLSHPTEGNAPSLQPTGENAYLPHPSGENTYLPHPAGENAYLPRPTEGNAYLPHPSGENAYLPRPTEENAYLPHPSGENAYLPRPDEEENSYLPDPTGEHTNIAQPTGGDIFLPFPSDEPHPTGENAYLPQPIGDTTVYLSETSGEIHNSSPIPTQTHHVESESGLPTDPATIHHGEVSLGEKGGSEIAGAEEGASDSESATNGKADPTSPVERSHEKPTDMSHDVHNQINVGKNRHTQTNTTVSMETHASSQQQHTGSDPAAHPPHQHAHDVREEDPTSLPSPGGDGGRPVQDHQVDHRYNAVATDGTPHDLQRGSVEESSILVQGVPVEDYDNTTMCAHKEHYFKVDQEFYDGCARFCICGSDLQVECRSIDCPNNSGLDIYDPDCIEWEHDASVTLAPPNCCPELRCKTSAICDYMGREFRNFDTIPRELTGCSQECTCTSGNVSCVDLCPPVPPSAPQHLPCPPEAAVLVTLPGETCCRDWQCASHTVAGPHDFFPLPPLSLHPTEHPSFSLGPHRPGFSQESEIWKPDAMAIDAHSIHLHFMTPSVYVGLPGKLVIKFREDVKSGEQPGEWREEVLVPSGSLVSSSTWDHVLEGLSANTAYAMQVQLNLLGASENITSPPFTVMTQAAPETTTTTEPTTTTPLPDLEINPDLYASDITKNSAKITWRDFDENEMQYIDGIQVKYTAGGKLMPQFSQMFYRDNDQIILRDLASGTEYTVDLTFIPHEGQTSKITSNKPIIFSTLPEEDPYSFEIEAQVGKITSRTVELLYSGVPEPAEKYVNVLSAVYLRNDDRTSSTYFKLPKHEQKKFLFLDELKPDVEYQMWIEAYLSNGRKKQSNVLTVTTKAGELPKPERSEVDPALKEEPESDGGYYGAFVAVVIIAAIACLGFLALLAVLIRKQNHAKAHINSSKNNAAYDNPSYKVGDNTYDIEMNGLKGSNGARHPDEA